MFWIGLLVGIVVTFIMLVLVSAIELAHRADESEERMLAEKEAYKSEQKDTVKHNET